MVTFRELMMWRTTFRHAKRDRRICDAYVMCKEKTEDEVISTFLQLISSQASPGLHVIHIAAEMAPVAKGVHTPGGNRLLTKCDSNLLSVCCSTNHDVVFCNGGEYFT
ncbi:hypothetical protein ES319_D05G302500v1 [Gossypium barbadense]|uniref:Uncharacterized protein n=2 Tax=Gossypium barbadense TaxID=3634 RepID=A0A5J5RJG5_GOSBA|nr:hypothetical protein ES319_D05G302500v1 [Gossypium barbadense]KAB2031404.1 hypothetical protein ES319_D05G302500v1 [Gossypium barbadense]